MGPKTLPTIWGTYMTLVTKYQISVINSCWEKCAYMFNVYKDKLSRQTGSRNLTGPNTLPTIWYTYMMLVIKYQISAINSYWGKCEEKYLGRTDDRYNSIPPSPSGSGGTIISKICTGRGPIISQTCTGTGQIITVKPVLVEDQLLVKPVLVEDQLLVKPVLVEDQLLVKPVLVEVQLLVKLVLVEDQLLQSNLYWSRTNY